MGQGLFFGRAGNKARISLMFQSISRLTKFRVTDIPTTCRPVDLGSTYVPRDMPAIKRRLRAD